MRHRTKMSRMALLELMEPRVLLSGSLPSFAPSSDATVVVGRAIKEVVLGTLPNSHFAINSEATTKGPALLAIINWGDGSTSPADLFRDAKGKIEVEGKHNYATTGNFPVTVTTYTGTGSPRVALHKQVHVALNSVLGTTINGKVGAALSNVVVATFGGSRGSPLIKQPVASFHPPTWPGNEYAAFRIDWGDGTVTDAGIVSANARTYNITGTHTYQAPGAYRIIVFFYEVTPGVSGGTALGSFARSTARIAGGGAASLPQHATVTASQLFLTLPAGLPGDAVYNPVDGSFSAPATTTVSTTDIGGNNQSGDGTGSGGVLTLNGASGGYNSSTLIANGGDGTGGGGPFLSLGGSGGVNSSTGYINSTSLTVNGTNQLGSVTYGIGGTNSSSNALVGLTTYTNLNGTNSMILTGGLPNTTILNGTSGIFTGVLGNQTTGSNISLPSPAVIVVDPSGNFEASWLGVASNLLPVSASSQALAAILPSMHAGMISFDESTPVDSITADLQFLPPDFHGTVDLPAGTDVSSLPQRPAATYVVCDPGTIFPSPVTTFYAAITTLQVNQNNYSATGDGILLSGNIISLGKGLQLLVPHLSTANINFNVGVTASQILSVVNLLPADYHGTITLPDGVDPAMLPVLAGATYVTPTPPATT
jgi:hypothetical protein